MKTKKRYVCRECGYTVSSWLGKCPECLSWNSFIEEIKEDPKKSKSILSGSGIQKIETISKEVAGILPCGNKQLDNFFGEGLVTGSVVLLAGEPGAGKSTFLLFLVEKLSEKTKIFYFSGEESGGQIKKRYDRVCSKKADLYVSNEVDIEKIIEHCNTNKPDLIFLDSIQTCFTPNIDSAPGTVSQIKHSSSRLIGYAKSNNIPVIIVGHVTKSGEIAGPKVMEHMVDVVIYFENNLTSKFRMIRSVKNRYGTIDELLLFEMRQTGLFLIEDPSYYFIDKDSDNQHIGKCKTIIIEGKRPLLIEIESLVVPSAYANPRRYSEGIDVTRLNRIAAILDKHVGENLNNYDIYINISGGIKTQDVGVDLAIAAAIYSSKNKAVIENDIIYIGEVSLTGDVRNVYRMEQRVEECRKLGFSSIIAPGKQKNCQDISKISALKSFIS